MPKKNDSIIHNTSPIPTGDNADGTPYKVLLQDLQGNILNGHGRDYAVHIFVRFPRPANPGDSKDPVLGRVRAWIGRFAKERVTSAHQQTLDAQLFKESQDARVKAEAKKGMAASPKDEEGGKQTQGVPPLYDGGIFAHLALAAPAYKDQIDGGLGLGSFPIPQPAPPDPGEPIATPKDVYRQGMKSRQVELFDPPGGEWEAGYQDGPDALIILADDKPNRMIVIETAVVKSLLDLGARVLQVERGHTIWRKFNRKRSGEPEHGIPVEHFGYADGVSQPLFTDRQLQEDKETSPHISDEGGAITKQPWDPFAPLDLVLVKDPNGRPGVSYGSYLVFRKLEQNVRKFKIARKELAREMGISTALAGAMAVGRFEDATPLVLEPGDQSDAVTNNFNYDGDKAGLTCPFHAHIRKTNPRLESVKIDGPFAKTDAIELAHRIARRGVPYGGNLSEGEDPDDHPSNGVGLLFMCYQSNIEGQFEFMQRFWSNNPLFLEPALDGPGAAHYAGGTGLDAIIGQRRPGLKDESIPVPPGPPQNWPASWGKPTRKVECPVFADFVLLKGGEYFFSPSLTFMKAL